MMSSSERDEFVADAFDVPAAPRSVADETPWALDDFLVDDLFGAVSAHEEPLSAHFSVPGAAAGAAAPPTPPVPTIDPAELERLEAEAFARGRAEGERDGLARGEAIARAALEAPIAALQAALANLTAAEARWIHTLEENIAALAVGVAQHLVAREVEADPAVVRTLVQQAVAAFPIDQPLTIRVNPDDVAVIQEATQPATPTAPALREIRVTGDSHIVRGGALIEGRERIIDGRVDTGLERIFRAISQVQA